VNRTLAAALTAAAFLWALIVVCAPAALRSPVLATPAAGVYAAASRICHQRVERSFHDAGIQLPVCARCTGIYVSAAVGALGVWVFARPRRGVSPRIALFIAAAPTAITWLLEHLGGVPFSNVTRAVAAIPLGAVAGWLLVGLLRYDSRLG
jgi:uncharacterized membrane protein